MKVYILQSGLWEDTEGGVYEIYACRERAISEYNARFSKLEYPYHRCRTKEPLIQRAARDRDGGDWVSLCQHEVIV